MSMNAREAAYIVLENFFVHNEELDGSIDKTFKENEISPRDRRLAFEIIQGVMRTKKQLDKVIDLYLNPQLQEELRCRLVLEIGAYQILFLDRIPTHAATNESVNLTKRTPGLAHFTGAVNAVMRRIAKEGKKQIKQVQSSSWDSLTEELCERYSHPEWLVDRWVSNFGGTRTRKLLEFNNTKPDVYVRRITKRAGRRAFEADLAGVTPTAPLGVGYQKLYYKTVEKVHAADLESFKAGTCTVQAPSSGWVVALVDPQSTDHILDVSAAPGGKACMMADLQLEATVVAADVSMKRSAMILDTILRLGQINITPVVVDGTKPAYSAQFDKVLIDAPCTGTGVFHRHPESRWLRDQRSLDNALVRQRELLDASAPLVKPGGVLVYATCSIEPEENEEQVIAFLERHPEFEIESPKEYIDSKFVLRNRYLSILPQTHNMDGMFGARLKRKAD